MNVRRSLASILPAVLAAGLLAGWCAAEETRKEHSAVKPVPRDKDKRWMDMHKKFVEIAKRGGVDVLFLGDSITDAWGGEGHPKSPGAKIFKEEFEPLKAANFGIGGDRTQHVLWRLQHGELDGIKPRVVMLMIGTNNSNGKDNTSEEIAEGITAIVREVRKRSPKTKVLLLGIFPRATAKSAEQNKLQMEKIQEVNKIIAKLDDAGRHVKYVDIGKQFLAPDGSIPRDVMPDRLHLSPKGYRIWAAAVKGTIKELLKGG
jgi:lysophospholipase L1-like esterase